MNGPDVVQDMSTSHFITIPHKDLQYIYIHIHYTIIYMKRTQSEHAYFKHLPFSSGWAAGTELKPDSLTCIQISTAASLKDWFCAF